MKSLVSLLLANFTGNMLQKLSGKSAALRCNDNSPALQCRVSERTGSVASRRTISFSDWGLRPSLRGGNVLPSVPALKVPGYAHASRCDETRISLPVAGSVYRQLTLTTPGAPAGHWNVTVTPTFEISARDLTDQQLAASKRSFADYRVTKREFGNVQNDEVTGFHIIGPDILSIHFKPAQPPTLC